MLIGDELRALRTNDGPQRHAQAAMHRRIEAWRAAPLVASVEAGLQRFAEGEALEAIPALAAVMTADGAKAFAEEFIAGVAQELRSGPLGHVARRHTNDAHQSSLLLAKAGRVTLSLVTRFARPEGEPEATSCLLTDIDTWDVVLKGGIEGRLIDVRGSEPEPRFFPAPLGLGEGDVSHRPGRSRVLAIDRIDRVFTVLRLQRRSETPCPSRSYDLSSGTFLQQVAGDARDSRMELMMALLGRMERREDAPILAEIARGADNPSVRWEAIREGLALDTATGFTVLAEIARRVGDPLQREAASLHARLLSAHPQLRQLEDASCPA